VLLLPVVLFEVAMALLQTSQKAYLESAGYAVGTEPTFKF